MFIVTNLIIKYSLVNDKLFIFPHMRNSYETAETFHLKVIYMAMYWALS